MLRSWPLLLHLQGPRCSIFTTLLLFSLPRFLRFSHRCILSPCFCLARVSCLSALFSDFLGFSFSGFPDFHS